VELLVAVAVAAAVLTAAVLCYSALTNYRPASSYGAVQLPAGTMENFYPGETGPYVDTYFAPNYGRCALAEQLRETFYEDLDHANAVFCLERSGLSTIRPQSIPIDPTYDARRLDTPEAFRAFLGAALPASASVFSAYRGAATAQNLSIFVLMPSGSSSELSVRAIYEMDFVPTTNPAGTYASVRRYQGDVCTDFYDVFYPASSGATIPFEPVAVHFERQARLATVEGSSTDLFKVAANRPFYFVWWPDPSMPALEAAESNTYPSSDPRSAYATMVGRTSFFMVVPVFPAL